MSKKVIRNPKKVAVFSLKFPPELGVATFRISAFCKVLMDFGYSVSVYTKSTGNNSNFLSEYVNGIRKWKINGKSKSSISLSYFLGALKVIFSDTSTVIITGSPFYYFLLTPFLRIFGVSVILDFRDPWALRPEFDVGRTAKLMESVAIKYADKCIFVNDFVLKSYGSVYGSESKKFFVVENGYFPLDLSSVEIDKSTFDKVRDFLASRTCVVYSGRVYYRDIRPFLEFLRSNIDNICLLKIGPKEPEFERLVDEMGCRQSVYNAGFVSYEVAQKMVSEFSDINLVITSDFDWEASTKIFDGLPVKKPTLALAPPQSYASYVLRFTDSGLTCKNTVEEIAPAFHRIVNREFTFDNCEKYSRENQASKILDFV